VNTIFIGGDLQKWQQQQLRYLLGVDVAEQSIEHAKERYRHLASRNRSIFPARYVSGDAFGVGK